MHSKALTQAHLLNTLHMVILLEKKFLKRFENQSHAEKPRFWGFTDALISVSFFEKMKIFHFFCQQNFLKVLDDHSEITER